LLPQIGVREAQIVKQMHFGLFLHGTGSHIAGWRPPGAMDSNQKFAFLREIAAQAERAKFDLLFVGDSLNADVNAHPSYVARLEPLTMLSALAVTTTSRIGLAATASTTYSDPYSIARVFASLDHISNGRAGWNAVTTSDSAAGANFGVEHPDHGSRYEIATEFVEVVKGLWDCWADDAIVADRRTGVFIDPQKVRPLNHKGKFFSVRGPMNISRSPQGHPVVIQAGGSAPGKRLAAKTADLVFSVVQEFDEARKDYEAMKGLIVECGRSPDDVTIMPGVMPVVGRTEQEAREKLNYLQSFVDNANAMQMLSHRLGVDLSNFDLDGPVPDVPLTDGGQSFARVMLAKAKRESMTLRELYNLTAASRGHWVLCGSAETVADTLEHWFKGGAADGFNVMPSHFPEGFEDFIELVLPILQERHLFRADYAGSTLREHLGLLRPKNSNFSPAPKEGLAVRVS
jgi:FMN-dependent oxidoreductase (nitrilotriacetate monooxygenase family)